MNAFRMHAYVGEQKIKHIIHWSYLFVDGILHCDRCAYILDETETQTSVQSQVWNFRPFSFDPLRVFRCGGYQVSQGHLVDVFNQVPYLRWYE